MLPANPFMCAGGQHANRLAIPPIEMRGRARQCFQSPKEKPFVPRFLEGKPPQKRRRKLFPADDAEFCICAANAFARDGHSVLVYSPQRGQVEKLAREFRHMHDQGYLGDVADPKATASLITRAIASGMARRTTPCTSGTRNRVGAHHGALPRPFLNAIAGLLDARQLSVAVASPTLAQPNVSGHSHNTEVSVCLRKVDANGFNDRINYQLDGSSNVESDRAGIRLLPISQTWIEEVQAVNNGFAPEFGNTVRYAIQHDYPLGHE